MMMMLMKVRLYILLGAALLLLIPLPPSECLDTSSDVYILCNTQTYDNGSSFDGQLNTILTALKKKAASLSYDVDTADTLMAAYQCRGDLPQDTCSQCVADAAQSALSSCPHAIGSRVQLDGCFLRYENYSFVVPDTSIVVELCNVNKDESSAFQGDVTSLLRQVTGAAPSDKRLFSAASSSVSANTSSTNSRLYALAQCLGYLSQAECSDCLAAHSSSWQVCDHAVGAQIHSVSCYYRFETYAFFYE